jgi:protein SCO1/2
MYPVPAFAPETHVTKRQRNYLLHLDVYIKVRTLRNKEHKRLGVLLSVSVLLAACGQSSTNNQELFGYVPPTTKDVSQAFIADAATNTPFNFVAAPNELLIAYFGYTHCPDLCPTTLVNIKNAKKKMGELADRVDLAMITVDPNRDTKDVLPRYLASLSDRFHALIPSSTSELRDAEELFQTSSSVTVAGDKVEVVHSGSAYVIDDEGMVVVEWPFGIDAKSMAHDLTVLLNKKEKTT